MTVLNKIAHHSSRKINGELLNFEVEQLKTACLHLDEISIQSTTAFTNKVNLFGHSHNNLKELTMSTQVLLLSAIAGKKT